MSLIDEYMDDFVVMDKSTTPDGYGGFTASYSEGAAFRAAVVLDNSLQARIAEKDGVRGIYTVTTSKAVMLDFHDVFKRVKDGAFFRVTSKNEKATPASASLNMRQCNAEEYTLTDGE